MRLSDGREMPFARDDPQLRHLAYAYASTVHAAQGQTHDRVIAVLDTGAGPLVNQQTLYVQLSRAREQAVVLTDNREQLVETLEANTGERLTALEAIGETERVKAPAKRAVSGEAAAAFLEGLRAERAERAFAALPAAELDDRQALRDRAVAAELWRRRPRMEAFAAMDAARRTAVRAGRAPPFDEDAVEAAGRAAAGARARLDAWRSLEAALVGDADEAADRLAPEGTLLADRSLDMASIERHGKAAQEASAAFGAVARRAHAAGEAALAAAAEETASGYGLDERFWAYRLAGAPVRPWRSKRSGTWRRRRRSGTSGPGGGCASGRPTRAPKGPPSPRRLRRHMTARGTLRARRPSGACGWPNTGSRP